MGEGYEYKGKYYCDDHDNLIRDIDKLIVENDQLKQIITSKDHDIKNLVLENKLIKNKLIKKRNE